MFLDLDLRELSRLFTSWRNTNSRWSLLSPLSTLFTQVRCIKIHKNFIISGSWDKSAKVKINLEQFQMDRSAVGLKDGRVPAKSGPRETDPQRCNRRAQTAHGRHGGICVCLGPGECLQPRGWVGPPLHESSQCDGPCCL